MRRRKSQCTFKAVEDELSEDDYEEMFLRSPMLDFVSTLGTAYFAVFPFIFWLVACNWTAQIDGWERWPIRVVAVGGLYIVMLRIIKPYRRLKRFWREQDEEAFAARRVERELRRVRNQRELEEERWKLTEARLKADAADRHAQERAIRLLDEMGRDLHEIEI